MKTFHYLFFSFFLFALLSSCTYSEDSFTEKELLHVFYDHSVPVYLYEGSSLQPGTKSDNADYFTFSCDVPGKKDLIIENIHLEGGLILQKHFFEDGAFLASALLDSNGFPQSLEKSEYLNLSSLTKSGTWDDECIQEAYDEISEIIEDHWWSDILCNNFSFVCTAVKLYYAYVLCVPSYL